MQEHDKASAFALDQVVQALVSRCVDVNQSMNHLFDVGIKDEVAKSCLVQINRSETIETKDNCG